MSAIDLLGYSAGLAVLATFCMSSIVPLRIVAMVSNLLFVSYGLLAHLYPVFLLHAILLPINLLKLAQADLLLRNKNPIFGRALLSGLPSRKERV
jgi:CRP/FNR family transcriptional regulator, cyclic AMP receptor protein